jgi:hypothetical protein
VSDPNNDNVSVSFTQLSGIEASIEQFDGTSFIVAPQVDDTQELRYEATASDGNGNSVSTEFTIVVLNNEAPTIDSISAPTSASGGQRVTITVSASDPENDSLDIRIGGLQGSSVTLTTPRSGTSVNYDISVFDGVNTVTDTVSITLTQAPVSSGDSGGGGGSLGGLSLLGLSFILVFRRAYRAKGFI